MICDSNPFRTRSLAADPIEKPFAVSPFHTGPRIRLTEFSPRIQSQNPVPEISSCSDSEFLSTNDMNSGCQPRRPSTLLDVWPTDRANIFRCEESAVNLERRTHSLRFSQIRGEIESISISNQFVVRNSSNLEEKLDRRIWGFGRERERERQGWKRAFFLK